MPQSKKLTQSPIFYEVTMPSDLPFFDDNYPDMVPRPQVWVAAVLAFLLGISVGLMIASFALKH